MGDFPTPGPLPPTIWTGGPYGTVLGRRAMMAGSAGFTSQTFGSANLARAAPIYLPFAYPVKNIFWYNFATVTGNCDAGVYNWEFKLLLSAGTTAQGTASALQFVAKDFILDPGQYYFALTASSTTATYAAMGSGSAQRHAYNGECQMAAALPLPATFVPASMSAGFLPLVGVTNQSSPNF